MSVNSSVSLAASPPLPTPGSSHTLPIYSTFPISSLTVSATVPSYQRELKNMGQAILCRRIATAVCCFLSPVCWYGAIAMDDEERHHPFSEEPSCCGTCCHIVMNGWGGQCLENAEYYLNPQELAEYPTLLRAEEIASFVFPQVHGDTRNGIVHRILEYSREPPRAQRM